MRLKALEVSPGDRLELQRRVRSATAEQREVVRAKIVLAAAAGQSLVAIGEAVGLNPDQVGVWRQRYQAQGLEGLKDQPRSGRPLRYGHDDRLRIVKTICEEPPAPSSRWTMDAVAKSLADEVGISASQVWRICDRLSLKPWQVRSWMTSHDPDFWAKAADVCGLYLNPPENAMVWSLDEKTGMQAKSRVNPTRPARPATTGTAGTPARQEFEYRRHGTAVLFAGLNVHEGGVASWVTDSTRSANFVEFLGDIVAQTPNGLEVHCIVDNLSAHSTRAVEEFSICPVTTMCSCTTPRLTPAGSTRSSSSCRSSPVGFSSGASSTRSTTWPTESSPSSRTTTVTPNPSAGPMQVGPLKRRRTPR